MKLLKHTLPIIFAIIIIIADYQSQTLTKIRAALSYVNIPIYYIVDIPSQLYSWVKEQGTKRTQLINELNTLKNENKLLKLQLQTYNSILLKLQNLQKILNINYRIEHSNATLASISNVRQSRLKKQIIITKGSSDGIKNGQVAIASKGVVGQVIFTAMNHSTVLSITDPRHYIPVKNQRNNLRGIAQGIASYENKLKLNFIQKNADIKIGDIFVSSHIGSKFPENHPVGVVTRIKHSDDFFINIELTPIENINQLEFLLIINDK